VAAPSFSLDDANDLHPTKEKYVRLDNFSGSHRFEKWEPFVQCVHSVEMSGLLHAAYRCT